MRRRFRPPGQDEGLRRLGWIWFPDPAVGWTFGKPHTTCCRRHTALKAMIDLFSRSGCAVPGRFTGWGRLALLVSFGAAHRDAQSHARGAHDVNRLERFGQCDISLSLWLPRFRPSSLRGAARQHHPRVQAPRRLPRRARRWYARHEMTSNHRSRPLLAPRCAREEKRGSSRLSTL